MNNIENEKDILRKIWNETKVDNENLKNTLLVEIYEELRKPDDKMDCDLIKENIETLYLIAGEQYNSQTNADKELEKAKKAAKNSQLKFSRITQHKLFKPAFIMLLATIIILFTNFILVEATGSNIFDKIVEFGNDCISFNFKNDVHLVQNDNEGSLYAQIVNKCSAYDVQPLIPTVFPSDMKLINFTEKEPNDTTKTFSIEVSNNKNSMIIFIDSYININMMPTTKSPQTNDFTQIHLNGYDAYIIKNQDKYTIIMNYKNFVYDIVSSLPYNDTLTILKSMK
jgi:hypothetical protein